MSQNYQQLEKEIREEFEVAYRQKIKTMYSMFELKYQSLNDSIIQVYDRIKKDELLSTMFNDRTSSIHLQDRVKEIFSEVVAQERELIFKKMGTQITNLKFQNQELSRIIQKMKESTSNLQKQFQTQKVNIEQAKNNTDGELKKVKELNHRLEQEKQTIMNQLKNLKGKVEDLSEENMELNDLLNNLKGRQEQLITFKEEIINSRERTKMMQTQIDQLNQALVDCQERSERKYNQKKKEFKAKIEQYKTVITNLREQRLQTEISLKQTQSDQLQLESQKKIQSLVREYEKKIAEANRNKEREKQEIEKKYEYKLRETQNYFEKLLQAKIIESEENAEEFFRKIKQEGASLQEKVQFYQQNWRSDQEFQDQLSKREEIINMMRRKLEEFQEKGQNLAKMQEKLVKTIKELGSQLSEEKQKTQQLESINKSLTAKYKNYEESHNLLQINEKKTKNQFQEYDRWVRKTRDENEDLKKNIYQLEEELNHKDNTLREKQRKIRQTTEQIQILSKKCKKTEESLDNTVRDRQSIIFESKQLRKQLSNLEYKLKDQEMSSSLVMGSMESKLSNLTQDLHEKTQILSELQKKYQENSKQYQQQKRKNYELQSEIKNLEMEYKYFKENNQMQKNQFEVGKETLKKSLQEKNQQIQEFTAMLDKKNKEICDLSVKQKQELSAALSQNQKIKNKFISFSKTVKLRLEGLRKDVHLIKQFLSSRQSIISNDCQILQNSFMKQAILMSSAMQYRKQDEKKKVRQEMTCMKEEQMKQLKKQYEEKLKQQGKRFQEEKILFEKQIKGKDQKIYQSAQEVKDAQFILKNEKDQKKSLEKENRQLVSQIEQLKNSYEIKMNNLTKEMREEREVVVREYSDKKNQLEDEISNLLSCLKQLKAQTQLIQAKHDEQKLNIQAQLRTVKEQEEAVQKVACQKEQEIAKACKDVLRLEEQNSNLKGQLKRCTETLNQKNQLLNDFELKENQTMGEHSLLKSRVQRMGEEISELKRKLAQRQEELQENQILKSRMESELRDINRALNRSNKNQEIKSVREMSMQTLQLSQKVNEMRKCNAFLDTKTPLRS